MGRKLEWKTPLQVKRKDQLTEVIEGLSDYWPLTVRQVFYQMVSKGFMENSESMYDTVSNFLKWMRIDELIPWESLEDRTRTVTIKRGYENLGEFININVRDFLRGYSRCLVQGQDEYVEVWVEKDGLLPMVWEVADEYCLRAAGCKGYASIGFQIEYYKRASRALMSGKRPVILYLGDLDPDGILIPQKIQDTLNDDLELYGIEVIRIGLNPDHINRYDLQPYLSTRSKSNRKHREFVKLHGPHEYELDALHPSDLATIIRDAIKKELNLEDVKTQEIKEMYDLDNIKSYRDQVISFAENLQNEMFG